MSPASVTAILILLHWTVDGKPTLEGKLVGPCADADDPMACMHGILMHGDKVSGENHDAEDGYLKFKSNLETGAKAKVGPTDAEEMFHGALMHGDDDTNGVHEHKDTAVVNPESPKQVNLPEDIEDYMHGVLMHGDDEPGIDHKKDHQKMKEEKGESTNVATGPDDLEDMMHKMMHKDGDISHDHEKDDAPAVAKGPAEDLDNMMHKLMHKDGDISHNHEKDGAPADAKGAAEDLDNMMHKLMHKDGDISHNHEKDGGSAVAKGPAEDLDNMMHKLMHKDGDISHDHEIKSRFKVDKGPVDLDNMMHKLMHADGDISHDNEDRKENQDSDFSKGPGDIDNMMHRLMHKDGDLSHTTDDKDHHQQTGSIGPDSDDLHGLLMHGDKETGHVHEHFSWQKPFKMDKEALRKLKIDEDILRSVGLESVLQDLEEYDQWKKTKSKDTKDDMDDISENILSDIEAMKKRYLKRAREVDFKANVGITEKESLDHLAKTSGHEHVVDDATHSLELIGSTEPISERHKLFKEGKPSDDL
ncbi:LOW QUALITY PROTEIN: uncharacterized protein LOC117341636 [Pecten maximus]|uniref:LOW QUALITY PROTEIN: uncharacterized protein LOC117341636 n=1 Tax=Pecten maximus TaxID=6579 RepID=UPI0014582D96|nr:LOW QUALITY PROTEIN: uncharacterized protein LOC117341636 [Pecten maximus]